MLLIPIDLIQLDMPSPSVQFTVRLTAQMFEFLKGHTHVENQVPCTCAILMHLHSLNCIILKYNFSLYAFLVSQMIL